jgi:hypothetical protein
MNQHLVRVWGRDEGQIEQLRKPDLREGDDGALCYWFATGTERADFIESWPSGVWVVMDIVNPGIDDLYGEEMETRSMTWADVTLRLPSGSVHTFSMDFGYGYPAHAVRFMFEDGNYSCDCNKRIFLERYCGVPDEIDECGDEIELVSLVVRKVPLS